MKHTGSCSRECGHVLDTGYVLATPEAQHVLNTDPRVVEYHEVEDGEVFEFVYGHGWVDAIYLANAAQLGIGELA